MKKMLKYLIRYHGAGRMLALFLVLFLTGNILASESADSKGSEWQEKKQVREIEAPKVSGKQKKQDALDEIEITIQRSREIMIRELSGEEEEPKKDELLIVSGAKKEDDDETAMLGRPENYKDPTFYKQVIMIGDSRTVGLSQVCESPEGVTVIWSCKGAMGYIWMRDTGAPQIEPYLSEDTAIVILMGVNDVHFINEYLEYVNQKSLDWALRGADTYFCTVGPLTTESLYVTNPEVIAFNEALHLGLNSNVKIIELYDHMITHGFATFDGIHYSIPTDLDMFQYILSCLVNENGGVPGSIW